MVVALAGSAGRGATSSSGNNKRATCSSKDAENAIIESGRGKRKKPIVSASVLLLAESVIPVLAKNGWIGIKELGRLERSCKSCQLDDDVWNAVSRIRFPSTKDLPRRVIMDFGGHREYCRQRSAKPLREVAAGGRMLLPPASDSISSMLMSLDVYLGEKPVLNHVTPLDDFGAEGGISINLEDNELVILGNTKCYLERSCSCGKGCVGVDRHDFSQLSYSLTLIRNAELGSVSLASNAQCVCSLGSKMRQGDMHHLTKKYHTSGETGQVKYEEQGLALRQTSEAAEIRRRVKYCPIDINVRFCVSKDNQYDHLKRGNGEKYAITSLAIAIEVIHLVHRSPSSAVGDKCGNLFLFVNQETKKKYDLDGLTPFHIFEQLEGNDLGFRLDSDAFAPPNYYL